MAGKITRIGENDSFRTILQNKRSIKKLSSVPITKDISTNISSEISAIIFPTIFIDSREKIVTIIKTKRRTHPTVGLLLQPKFKVSMDAAEPHSSSLALATTSGTVTVVQGVRQQQKKAPSTHAQHRPVPPFPR